jgi:hypothetical protein
MQTSIRYSRSIIKEGNCRVIEQLPGSEIAQVCSWRCAKSNRIARSPKDGKVVVTREFCNSVYQFTPQEAGVEQAQ